MFNFERTETLSPDNVDSDFRDSQFICDVFHTWIYEEAHDMNSDDLLVTLIDVERHEREDRFVPYGNLDEKEKLTYEQTTYFKASVKRVSAKLIYSDETLERLKKSKRGSDLENLAAFAKCDTTYYALATIEDVRAFIAHHMIVN